eukprot:6144343-Alexandrium_andersonii.AAC.1
MSASLVGSEMCIRDRCRSCSRTLCSDGCRWPCVAPWPPRGPSGAGRRWRSATPTREARSPRS